MSSPSSQPCAYIQMLRRVITFAAQKLQSDPTDKSVWSAVSVTPRLTEVEILDDFWVAQASFPGHETPATLSIALTPGEVRIGVIIPQTAVELEGASLRQAISQVLGEHHADVVSARPGNLTLFDWHFHEDVFSSEWIRLMLDDPIREDIYVHRLTFLARTIWRGVTEVVLTSGWFDMKHDLLIESTDAISNLLLTDDLESIVSDSMFDGSKGKFLIVARSNMNDAEMQQALQLRGIAAEVRKIERAFS